MTSDEHNANSLPIYSGGTASVATEASQLF